MSTLIFPKHLRPNFYAKNDNKWMWYLPVLHVVWTTYCYWLAPRVWMNDSVVTTKLSSEHGSLWDVMPNQIHPWLELDRNLCRSKSGCKAPLKLLRLSLQLLTLKLATTLSTFSWFLLVFFWLLPFTWRKPNRLEIDSKDCKRWNVKDKESFAFAQYDDPLWPLFSFCNHINDYTMTSSFLSTMLSAKQCCS